MTRARYAVHLICSAKAAKSQASAGRLVIDALGLKVPSKKDEASQEPHTVLWEHGDPNWDATLQAQAQRKPDGDIATQPATRAAALSKPADAAAGAIRLAPVDGCRSRYARWVSPSRHGTSGQMRLGDFLRAETGDDARLMGTLLHACFESVEWIEDYKPDEAALGRRLIRVEGAGTEIIQDAVARFVGLLALPGHRQLLSRDFYQTADFPESDEVVVERERRFAVRRDEHFLGGVVDRVVLLKRAGQIVAADVVDFKTDDLSGSNDAAIRSRVDAYRPQMLAYRDAMARVLGLDVEKVTVRLFFTRIDRQIQIG
jgi:ATP-dependent exoDNAse (exonuclease V) beta subunit